MGAGLSGLGREIGVGSELKPSLGDLPESCLALVLSYLDPPEICKFARLNRAFRRASSTDFVWESKLPQNYQFLVQKLFDKSLERLSKKTIYATLCRPIPFDGGNKEVWLEKRGGGMCVSISWKGLKITGIYDRRYWNHIPTDESRFHTMAYLQQIWWLEVDGEVEFEFPEGSYSLFFRLQLGRGQKRLGRRVCNLEQVHGWDQKPVKFQLWTSNAQHATSHCYINNPGKWLYYHVGDFAIDDPTMPTKVNFSMTQIDCTHSKGGLCLDSVFVYPAEFKERLKHL